MSIIKSLFSKPGAFGKGSSMEAKIVFIQEILQAKVDHFCQFSVATSIASPTFVDCWWPLDVENTMNEWASLLAIALFCA